MKDITVQVTKNKATIQKEGYPKQVFYFAEEPTKVDIDEVIAEYTEDVLR